MYKILMIDNSASSVLKLRGGMVRELLAAGFEVVVSAPEHETARELRGMGCSHHPSVIDRRGLNPLKDLKLFFYYKKLVSGLKPDIVLTYTVKPNVYGGLACRLAKTPCICNVTGLGTGMNRGRALRGALSWLYRRAVKKNRCVFFQNSENLEIMRKLGITGQKNRVIPGSGVDLGEHVFTPYPDEDSGVKFLFIGRIMKEKGIDEFLYAARKIKQESPGAEFHIVGDIEEEAYRRALAPLEESDIVLYHGLRPDVRPYIRACHCTVLPSYHEGMANALIESAAAGRPVITSDIPGCREAVEDGESGLLCRTRDAESLYEAMLGFMFLTHEKKARMGLCGRQKAEKEFDRRTVIKAYMDEIGEILN